jgi:hypothetical protein
MQGGRRRPDQKPDGQTGYPLTEGKNLKREVVARTEESAEAGEDKKWNHGTGFIAKEPVPAPALIA